MTTLVGILVKNPNKQGVVLASDVASTAEFLEDRGEIILKTKARHSSQKIKLSDREVLAFAAAGLIDGNYHAFVKKFLSGEIDFDDALRIGGLDAFGEMNSKRQDKTSWDRGKDTELLIARYQRKGENSGPSLYRVHPLGQIEPIHFIGTLGSGSGHANRYLEVKIPELKREMDINDAIDLARGAMIYSSTDLYTGGFDIAILTENGTVHGRDIMERHYALAERKSLDEIKKAVHSTAKKTSNQQSDSQSS